MIQILAIAKNTFRETIRDRILNTILVFAVLLIGASILLGQLSAGQDVKIIKDLGLAAMALFGLFIAIFIGVGLVAREIERRSIYAILAKPVRRHEFIIGKYLGLVGTLVVNLTVMTVAYYGVLLYMNYTVSPGTLRASPTPPVDPRLLIAVVMIGCELALVTAVALFWSTFSSSALLSAGLTAGLYVAGQFGADLRNLGDVVESQVAANAGRALYYVLPNFASFDVKAEVVHGVALEPARLLLAAAYGTVYVLLLLVASVMIFSRRDFK